MTTEWRAIENVTPFPLRVPPSRGELWRDVAYAIADNPQFCTPTEVASYLGANPAAVAWVIEDLRAAGFLTGGSDAA